MKVLTISDVRKNFAAVVDSVIDGRLRRDTKMAHRSEENVRAGTEPVAIQGECRAAP